MTNLTYFKAYYTRGKLGEELNEDIAYCIGIPKILLKRITATGNV
jgi:hypothetical protein